MILGSWGGHVPVLPDEGDLGGVRFGEVDDDDGVFGEVHLAFDGRSGVDEFGPAEIADEDGVLESVTVFLHGFADSSEAFGVADVVGDQESSSCHVATWW